MTPEISHRCPSCGVAVRGTSLFCPQCGRPLKASATSINNKADATETPVGVKTDGGVNTSVIAPSGATTPPPTAPDIPPVKESAQPKVASENRSPVAATAPLAGDERSKRQRVTAAARETVEGKIAPRVEKLRHASGAMLEEASYDPSLRFVLVAVVIFLLSLLLLLLNRLLG
ncbi:MAG TPA: zinc ribbon domain-containing protein [Pyrinomonadaceae bacterium]|nr:zinc ribbon domain-containing protein [Pyrinomonadaceae bacterium]